MIAPFPKRRSICERASSMAFSRSVVAADTAVVLRSAIVLSFLVIGMCFHRVYGTGRILPILLTALHSSFFEWQEINKRIHCRCTSRFLCCYTPLFFRRVEKAETGLSLHLSPNVEQEYHTSINMSSRA